MRTDQSTHSKVDYARTIKSHSRCLCIEKASTGHNVFLTIGVCHDTCLHTGKVYHRATAALFLVLGSLRPTHSLRRGIYTRLLHPNEFWQCACWSIFSLFSVYTVPQPPICDNSAAVQCASSAEGCVGSANAVAAWKSTFSA